MKIFESWMSAQKDRVWIACPFIDSLGVAMINTAAHGEVKIICRRGKDIVDLRPGIALKLSAKIHVKLYIGDRSFLFGSPNLNLASFMTNQELLMRFTEKKILEKAMLYFDVLWA
ncbi:MAG: hypothetical protein H8D26_03150 [Methanomicrobia archaeon]|nr:hypothetical protein [Methanomicrobia archaeon]